MPLTTTKPHSWLLSRCMLARRANQRLVDEPTIGIGESCVRGIWAALASEFRTGQMLMDRKTRPLYRILRCLHLQVLKSASIKTVSSGQCKCVGHHWEMSVREVPLYTQLRYIQVEAQLNTWSCSLHPCLFDAWWKYIHATVTESNHHIGL